MLRGIKNNASDDARVLLSEQLAAWKHGLDMKRKEDGRVCEQKWFTGEKFISFCAGTGGSPGGWELWASCHAHRRAALSAARCGGLWLLPSTPSSPSNPRWGGFGPGPNLGFSSTAVVNSPRRLREGEGSGPEFPTLSYVGG